MGLGLILTTKHHLKSKIFENLVTKKKMEHGTLGYTTIEYLKNITKWNMKYWGIVVLKNINSSKMAHGI